MFCSTHTESTANRYPESFRRKAIFLRQKSTYTANLILAYHLRRIRGSTSLPSSSLKEKQFKEKENQKTIHRSGEHAILEVRLGIYGQSNPQLNPQMNPQSNPQSDGPILQTQRWC